MSISRLSAEPISRAWKSPCEDAMQVSAHLSSFRRWVKSLPHIKCPLDDEFLLAFLRTTKFVHYEALKLLEGFCAMHCTLVNISSLQTPSSVLGDPGLDAYLKSGFLIELGRINSGVTMVLIRLHVKSLLQRSTLQKFIMLDFDRLLMTDRTQLKGFGVIHDLEGSGIVNLLCDVYRRFISSGNRLIRKAYPLLGLYSIYCNEPLAMKWAFNLCSIFTEEHRKPEVMFVHADMRRAFERLPGLKAIMPSEYGGENGSIEDLIVKHEQQFRDYYSQQKHWQSIEIDESRIPVQRRN